MKKLFVIAMMIAVITATQSTLAAKADKIELSPMVLIELQASMRADLLLAERYMTLEIRDELKQQTNLVIDESLLQETTIIFEGLFDLTDNWSLAAQE
jgi:hypothetical protein